MSSVSSGKVNMTMSNSGYNYFYYDDPAVDHHHGLVDTEDGVIRFRVAANDDGAIAVAKVNFMGDEYVAQASTKRRSGERPNVELAKKLAAARVLEKVSRRVRRQADGLLKHEEDLREGKIEDSKSSVVYTHTLGDEHGRTWPARVEEGLVYYMHPAGFEDRLEIEVGGLERLIKEGRSKFLTLTRIR